MNLVLTRVSTLAVARRDDPVAERKQAAADQYRLYVEGDGSASVQRYPAPTQIPINRLKCDLFESVDLANARPRSRGCDG